MNKTDADIGLIGLGTMGSALALNMAENKFSVAIFNRTAARTAQFVDEAGDFAQRLLPTQDLKTFVGSIRRPRRIVLMVPAGPVVDAQITALEPYLESGDVIVDAGNANYHDTNRRNELAKDKPYDVIGLGVSGGEEGARFGPSMMGGGVKQSWSLLEDVLTAISAKHTDGTPCVAWLGPQGAGHFVKMIHNGIEYADMQMIAEIYGILRDGYGWTSEQCGSLFARWNDGLLRSYLIEISAEICATTDPKTNKPILDVILDKAGQKGTGRWTAIEAQHLGVPVPVIEAAVSARNMSARLSMREQGAQLYNGPIVPQDNEPDVQQLEAAMIAGKIICYAQGFEMIAKAAQEFDWPLPKAEVARVWRAGCIIRSAMLDDMATAFEQGAEHLAFAPYFARLLGANANALRQTVARATLAGAPVPCLSSAMSWLDQIRMQRSTANMIQGQRDYFGRHRFKRIDAQGDHHGPWAD